MSLLSPHIDNQIDWVQPVNWLHPLNRGLIAWWKCIPGAMGGAIWPDLCRNYRGTLTSMDPATDWVAGRSMGAMEFASASSQYVALSGGPTRVPITVSCWIKPAAVGSDMTVVGFGNSGATAQYFQIMVNNVATVRCDERNSTSGTSTSSATVAAGVWSHVAAVFLNDSSRTSFVNAVASTTNTTSITAPTINIWAIGRRNTAGVYFDGQIDDVRVWNRALSNQEISDVYLDGYQGTLNRIYMPRALPPTAATGNRRRRQLICGASS